MDPEASNSPSSTLTSPRVVRSPWISTRPPSARKSAQVRDVLNSASPSHLTSPITSNSPPVAKFSTIPPSSTIRSPSTRPNFITELLETLVSLILGNLLQSADDSRQGPAHPNRSFPSSPKLILIEPCLTHLLRAYDPG